jgi:hypothetical protein
MFIYTKNELNLLRFNALLDANSKSISCLESFKSSSTANEASSTGDEDEEGRHSGYYVITMVSKKKRF